MFTQESENLAKVSHAIGCDIRLALFELDKVESSIEEVKDVIAPGRSHEAKEKIRDARNHVLNITFKLMEFSANPAGPKPEPSTKD
jgi:hypothetical protein